MPSDTLFDLTEDLRALGGGRVWSLMVSLFGSWFVGIVLGAKYAGLETLLIWLAILQAARVIKAGPAIVALAQGETGNAMWANVPRIAVLPVIWWAAVQGAGRAGRISADNPSESLPSTARGSKE